MKKNFTRLAMFVVGVALMWSCAPSSQIAENEGPSQLELRAVQGQFLEDLPSQPQNQTETADQTEKVDQATISTRATETAFQDGDAIGVYVHTTASVGVDNTNHSSNMKYSTRDGGATWRAGNALGDKFLSGVDYKATAYYPQTSSVANAQAIAHSVAQDQSVAAGASAGPLERSDFMISDVTSVVDPLSPSPKVSFAMKHVMTKLVVKLTVPKIIDGVDVVKVKSVTISGTKLSAVVNLATKSVVVDGGAQVGDILPRLAVGDGLAGEVCSYEAIVVPQVVASKTKMVSIICETTTGGDKELTYTVPAAAPLTLGSGKKVTLTLSSTSDVAFTKELDLIDGMAKEDLEFGIKVLAGANWTLTAPDGGWLKLAKTTSDVPTYSLSGTGTGNEEIVYVTVDANIATTGGIVREATVVLKSGGVSTTYLATQNYYSFGVQTENIYLPVGDSVLAVTAFSSNQLWQAKSSESWLKLSTSATYGEGYGSDPMIYGPVAGPLGADKMFYHAEKSKGDAVRTATITFSSTSNPGAATVTQTITQGPQGILIGKLWWAKGNLVADGANGAKIGAPTDCGIFFQFGSLIAWTGGANGDGVGLNAQPGLAIKVKPKTYSANPGWAACPKFTAGTDANTIVPFATDNGASGIGDPCRFYLGSPWRLPTTDEYKALCNGVGGINQAWASCNAAWQASPAGGNFNNNATKLFIPASGYRSLSDGSFYVVGTGGYGWSSSVQSASHGFRLSFNSSYVYPQYYSSRSNGFPVRCVQ